MTKKEFVLKAKIQNPFDDLTKLEEKADELIKAGYLDKDVKHRTNLPDKKTGLTPAQIAKIYFTEGIDGNIHKRLIEINGDIKQELIKFDSYWTELNKSGTQQRRQQQKTFEVQKRLTTWLGNNKTGNTIGQKKLTMI